MFNAVVLIINTFNNALRSLEICSNVSSSEFLLKLSLKHAWRETTDVLNPRVQMLMKLWFCWCQRWIEKLSQSKTVWSVNTQTLREHIYSIWTPKTRDTTRKMSGKHSSRSKSSLQNLRKHMIHCRKNNDMPV